MKRDLIAILKEKSEEYKEESFQVATLGYIAGPIFYAAKSEACKEVISIIESMVKCSQCNSYVQKVVTPVDEVFCSDECFLKKPKESQTDSPF